MSLNPRTSNNLKIDFCSFSPYLLKKTKKKLRWEQLSGLDIWVNFMVNKHFNISWVPGAMHIQGYVSVSDSKWGIHLTSSFHHWRPADPCPTINGPSERPASLHPPSPTHLQKASASVSKVLSWFNLPDANPPGPGFRINRKHLHWSSGTVVIKRRKKNRLSGKGN